MASSGQLYLAWQAHQMNDRAEIERQREAETGLGQKTLQNICPQISWQLRTVSIFSLFCLFQVCSINTGSVQFWLLLKVKIYLTYSAVQLFILGF
jgi:hypothetical protein